MKRYSVTPSYAMSEASTDLSDSFAITCDGFDTGIRCEDEKTADRVAGLLQVDESARIIAAIRTAPRGFGLARLN